MHADHVRSDEARNTAAGNDASSTFLDLKYRGHALISVRGSVTGKLYHFSANMPVRAVDVRDARFLLASRLFTIFP